MVIAGLSQAAAQFPPVPGQAASGGQQSVAFPPPPGQAQAPQDSVFPPPPGQASARQDSAFPPAPGQGQTSASFLVGRNTNGEKMGPFRVDQGPKTFRGLAAHEHTLRVRK